MCFKLVKKTKIYQKGLITCMLLKVDFLDCFMLGDDEY